MPTQLTNCKTCGKEVSRTAPTCPHCGGKSPGVKPSEIFTSKVSGANLVTALIVVIGGLWFISHKTENGSATSAPLSTSTAAVGIISEPAIARASAEAVPQCSNYETLIASQCSKDDIYAAEARFSKLHTKWFYSQTPGQSAIVYSLNSFIFGPLSSGRYERSSLNIMKGPGFDSISIHSGFFLSGAKLKCVAIDCPISVRFDQGPLNTYGTVGGGMESATLSSSKDFIENIQRSKQAEIVLPLEDYGNITFEFDISDYKW